MTLNIQQIKMLRTMGRQLKPTVIVGKEGMTQSVAERTNEVLEAHELVKVSLLDTSELTPGEVADQLAARTHSEIVQVIGHKVVLYRETKRKGAKKILG